MPAAASRTAGGASIDGGAAEAKRNGRSRADCALHVRPGDRFADRLGVSHVVLRIDSRWGVNDAHLRRYAAELIALSPEVILASTGFGGAAAEASKRRGV